MPGILLRILCCAVVSLLATQLDRWEGLVRVRACCHDYLFLFYSVTYTRHVPRGELWVSVMCDVCDVRPLTPHTAVYDVLTGDIVTTLKADSTQGVVRDVSWHPTLPGQLVTSSVSHTH